MNRKIFPIVGASLLLGILFDYFFYDHTPGINFFLYCLFIVSITFALAKYIRKTVNKSNLLLALPFLFFSGMLFVRDNAFVNFLNVIFALFLLLLIGQLLLRPNKEIWAYDFKDYGSRLITFPFEGIGEFFNFLGKLLSSTGETKLNKRPVTPIVRGTILSLPILFVFLLLLSSADLVFRRLVGSIFDFNLSPELVFRTLLVLFVASLFLGVYALLFTSTKSKTKQELKQKQMSLGSIESYIVLGSVSVLFLIFVLIQLSYLFGGQGLIESTGYTYAEYARKGFFELIAVAVISLGLLFAMNHLTVRQTLKQKVIFMWLSGLLIIEVLIIMLSAHSRLSLYEQTYGFTELRLYSHIFIAWLAVVFVMLLAHIMLERRENKLAFQVFLTLIAFMALTNLINPDAFVARQNIERLHNTGKIDLGYLYGLSNDAVPEITRLLDDSNETTRKSVSGYLYNEKQALAQRDKSWQSFNISRTNAVNILNKTSDKLEPNESSPDFYRD